MSLAVKFTNSAVKPSFLADKIGKLAGKAFKAGCLFLSAGIFLILPRPVSICIKNSPISRYSPPIIRILYYPPAKTKQKMTGSQKEKKVGYIQGSDQ
ncbi:hypothetical protein PBF_01380 [Cytobacillus firmus DS1]|uniref:Uncharacterized protein n=1 Tax=Cytobacillus firmus DS1 TaxID=1307436 RepID=W7L3K9_CYTFI|nr:hypothetical protein PBF_01380 [Cytobacillus firmus DS1]